MKLSLTILLMMAIPSLAFAGGIKINNRDGVVELPGGERIGGGTITINTLSATSPQETITVNNTLTLNQQLNVSVLSVTTMVDDDDNPIVDLATPGTLTLGGSTGGPAQVTAVVVPSGAELTAPVVNITTIRGASYPSSSISINNNGITIGGPVNIEEPLLGTGSVTDAVLFERYDLSNGTRTWTGHHNAGGHRLENLATPVSGSDAARLSDITDGIAALGGSLFAGGDRNLIASQTGNTTVTVTADAIDTSSTTQTFTVSNVNLTCDLATSGAGGLDTGSIATSTHYDIGLTTQSGSNPKLIGMVAGASLTYPSGYNTWRHVAYCLTNGSAQIYPFIKYGRKYHYRFDYTGTYRVLSAGTASGYSAVSAAGWIPPGIRLMYGNVAVGSSGGTWHFFLQEPGTSEETIITTLNTGDSIWSVQPIPLDSSRQFGYKVSSGGNATVVPWGYEDPK